MVVRHAPRFRMGHPMISYSFDRAPIYTAGHAAAGWAVVIMIFALLAFA